METILSQISQGRDEHAKNLQAHLQAPNEDSAGRDEHTKNLQGHLQAPNVEPEGRDEHAKNLQDHLQASNEETEGRHGREEHTKNLQDHLQASNEETQGREEHAEILQDHLQASNEDTENRKEHTNDHLPALFDTNQSFKSRWLGLIQSRKSLVTGMMALLIVLVLSTILFVFLSSMNPSCDSSDISPKDVNVTSKSTLSTSTGNEIAIRKTRKTARKVPLLPFEKLPLAEPNASGEYLSFYWTGEIWENCWTDILKGKYERLYLPPLMLNFYKNVVIVLYGIRHENEFWICGHLHPKNSSNVSSLNVRLELSFTFTKKDNTTLTVDKQIIATVENGSGHWMNQFMEGDWIFKWYDIPFDSLTLFLLPSVTKLSIKPILPEQKWVYWGLEPYIHVSSTENTQLTDCNSLHGTFNCAREWKKMVARVDFFTRILLPPFRLEKEDITICVFAERSFMGAHLNFRAKIHSTCPENVTSHDYEFKIDLNMTKRDSTIFHRDAIITTSVTRTPVWLTSIFSIMIPWDSISPFCAPRFGLSIAIKD